MSRSTRSSDVANATTLFCAFLSVLAAFSNIHTAAAHFMSGILKSASESSVTGLGWNLTDSAAGIAAAPKLFRKAETSILNPQAQLVLAWINAAHSGAVLPGLSAWGFATVVKSVEAVGAKALIYTGGATLGTAAALAGSSFAFAAGMFVNASISGYAWYRATQPDAPYALLEDKIDEFDELEKKKRMLNAEIASLSGKKIFYSDEPKKLEQLNNLKAGLTTLKTKQTQVKNDIEALYACALEREKSGSTSENPKPLIPDDKKEKITQEVVRTTGKKEVVLKASTRSADGEALIQKQIRDKKRDTIANIAGGVGAILGGLAVLLPPAAVPLLIGCAVCFAVCAVMKGIAWYEKRQVAKTLVESVPSR